MSADALAAALSAIGHPCEVDMHERMAVLRPAGGAGMMADDALRARIVSLATEHGFTHVAVELTDDGVVQERASAVVPGD
jgi:hypothetical protein